MDTTDSVFVGREVEIAELEQSLTAAARGSMQVCLVAGDPGDGKTTLVERFVEAAKETNHELDYAIGTCDISTGKLDIYDPFRDIFAQLTGIRAKSVESFMTSEREFDTFNLIRVTTEILRDFAPELIGTLVPGAGLLSKVALSAADKVIRRRIQAAGDREGKIEHEEIRKQSVAFFQRRATAQRPLILVLDDVQWMDSLSLALLVHLIRQLENAALLVILTYRPSELVAGGEVGHIASILDLINWTKMHGNPLVIDLRQSRVSRGREFVQRFLEDSSCDVAPEFIDEFYRRTDARPLFVVELLRFLKDRKVLGANILGIWRETSGDQDWRTIPTRLTRPEALIEDRLAQLDEEQQEILRLAAIEGYEFTAQVIVSITGIDERKVLRVLSDELGRKHDLVRELTEERVGHGVLSHFRFTNVWYQDHVYTSIGMCERRLLHERVAQTLETLYEGDALQIVVSLSHHYELGRNLVKAVDYLLEAGTQQVAHSQYDEALQTYERALSLSREVDYHTGTIDALRYIAGRVKLSKGGPENYREAERILEECHPLAKEKERLDALCFILRAQGRIHSYNGRNTEAMYCYLESIRVATQIGDKRQVAACFNNIGVLALREGRVKDARFYFTRRLDLADEIDDDEGRVISLMNLSDCLRMEARKEAEEKHGALAEAARMLERAKLINDQLSHLSRSAGILTLQARVCIEQGEPQKAAGLLRESIAISQQEDLKSRTLDSLVGFVCLVESRNAKDGLVPEVIAFVAKYGSASQRKEIDELRTRASGQYAESELEGAAQRVGHSDDSELIDGVMSFLVKFSPELSSASDSHT